MNDIKKLSNWVDEKTFQKLAVSGKRFLWRTCIECRHFDRFKKNHCHHVGTTTSGASCDFWMDISL